MHIATIRSLVHNRVENLILLPSEGFYELEVHVTEEQLTLSNDPQGFVNHLIAKHLASCAHNTSVPMGEGLWYVQFSPWARLNLNLPMEAWF